MEVAFWIWTLVLTGIANIPRLVLWRICLSLNDRGTAPVCLAPRFWFSTSLPRRMSIISIWILGGDLESVVENATAVKIPIYIGGEGEP